MDNVDVLTLSLSRSQQMALTSILVAYMQHDEPQSFFDVVRDTATTTPELLKLVTEAAR